MSKPLSLRKNFMWTSSGTMVVSAAQLIILIIVEKMAGTNSLGTFSLAIAISMPVYTALGLSLGRVLVVDAKDEHSFAEYFGISIFLNIISLCIVVSIAAWRQFSLETTMIIVFVAVWHYFVKMFLLSSALFQKHECMNYLGISRILYGIALVFGMALGLYIFGNLAGALAVLCVLSSCLFFFYDLRNVRRFTSIKPFFNIGILKQMISKCWLISLASGATCMTTQLPRLILKGAMDETYVGYFVGITLITAGTTLVVVSLAQSALRRLAVLFQSNINGFTRLLAKLIIIAIGFSLLNLLFTLVAGKYFLRVFFNESYAKFWPAMIIFSFAGFFSIINAIMGDTVVSTRRYGWRLFGSISFLVVAYFAALWWVPERGLNGMAFACLLGSATEFLICAGFLYVVAKKTPSARLLSGRN